jgi:1,4-dihydroxy-2-naphthoyl-CoA hydrolase
MRIWQQPLTLDSLHQLSANTAISHLGIEFVEIGDDYLSARMPVDARSRQPMGLLHGGASVLLAETLGSCAALAASPPGHTVVGLEINANHLRAVRAGWVQGISRPQHIGRSTQVWAIEIHDPAGQLACISRLTLAVLRPRQPA